MAHARRRSGHSVQNISSTTGDYVLVQMHQFHYRVHKGGGEQTEGGAGSHTPAQAGRAAGAMSPSPRERRLWRRILDVASRHEVLEGKVSEVVVGVPSLSSRLFVSFSSRGRRSDCGPGSACGRSFVAGILASAAECRWPPDEEYRWSRLSVSGTHGPDHAATRDVGGHRRNAIVLPTWSTVGRVRLAVEALPRGSWPPPPSVACPGSPSLEGAKNAAA